MVENSYKLLELSEIDFDIDDNDYIYCTCNESDAFKKTKHPIVCTINNQFKEFLAAQYKSEGVIAVFGPQSPEVQTTFRLETYISWPPGKGLPVAFTVSVNKEMWYMSCTDNKEITFEKGHSPSQIPENTSNIIFIFKDFSAAHGDGFKFESSRHKDYYLAFKDENNKRKLYLKKPSDVVDESTRFEVHDQ